MKKVSAFLLAALVMGALASPVVAQGSNSRSQNQPEKLTHQILVSQYNFPVKKNTGNAELDQQAYAAAKKKWVAENQELYRRYNEQQRASQPSVSSSRR